MVAAHSGALVPASSVGRSLDEEERLAGKELTCFDPTKFGAHNIFCVDRSLWRLVVDDEADVPPPAPAAPDGAGAAHPHPLHGAHRSPHGGARRRSHRKDLHPSEHRRALANAANVERFFDGHPDGVPPEHHDPPPGAAPHGKRRRAPGRSWRTSRPKPSRAWLEAFACLPLAAEGSGGAFSELCRDLFEAGDLDAQDAKGRTLLWHAVDRTDADACEVLLAYQRRHGYLNLTKHADDRKRLTPLALAEKTEAFDDGKVLAVFKRDGAAAPPGAASSPPGALPLERQGSRVEMAPRKRTSLLFGAKHDEYASSQTRDKKRPRPKLATIVRTMRIWKRAPAASGGEEEHGAGNDDTNNAAGGGDDDAGPPDWMGSPAWKRAKGVAY